MERHDRADPHDLSRWGREDLPPDPFGAHKERGGFEPPTRGAGEIGLFTARVRYRLDPTGTGTRLTNAVDLGSSGC
jgi:hypothetical protein